MGSRDGGRDGGICDLVVVKVGGEHYIHMPEPSWTYDTT